LKEFVRKKGLTRFRKWLVGMLLVGGIALFSGCRTVSFYAQAVKGQYQMFAHDKAIKKLMADTNTPPKLKARFERLEELRAFAQSDLKLPVDDHYRKYTDLGRPYAVWNVEAAQEFSMQPKSWWYPFVGSLEYQGYFSLKGATNYAAYLKKKGYDVTVGGVVAYSTLGWFKDPVLNTFIYEADADLAEIIFHELGHQRVFASGDMDFNEAFATTVGQEGARRWLVSKGDKAALDTYTAEIHHTAQFAHLVAETRLRLEALFGDERTEEGKVKSTKAKKDVPREELRQGKERIMVEMKQEFARLRAQWGSDTQYDSWMQLEVNNAHLNSVAAYYDLVPGFERLLANNGGDLEKFYQAVERLSDMSKKKRHEELEKLIPKGETTPAATTSVSR
jgi:predicted aminopeptidase